VDESKIHIRTPLGEVLVRKADLDPGKWMEFPRTGLRQYVLWVHPETGASIALLDFPEGSGVPEKHTHASNQFMYCLEGEYEYTDSRITLRPGDFYMNPKDHPHGPTLAHKRCLLLEVYDGPHYYEAPAYHTKDTIGKVVPRDR
jgi:anti-sigma factor ChrR (cupin superfamily)